MTGPSLSVVVVFHDMAREAPRTLMSLSAGYQRHIKAEDYEIVAVDNGSGVPITEAVFDGLAGNFRLVSIEPGHPSPAHAINRGLEVARGNVIGVMIDGARLVTPGMLHYALKGVGLYGRAAVLTLGWYLGHDHQRWSIATGYTKAAEDELLDSIGWPKDGYRLFEVSCMDGSSTDGWFATIAESNALFLSRASWDALGGAEERFDAPGGGLVNHDLLRRVLSLADLEPVILLGEGTFHQLHGGIANNSPFEDFEGLLAGWRADYAAIRGEAWRPIRPKSRTYLGALPEAALRHFVKAAIAPTGRSLPAFGAGFDRELWRGPVALPADPRIADAMRVAERELRARRPAAAAAVARLVRRRAPKEASALEMLAVTGPAFRAQEPAAERRAGVHAARGRAFEALGERPAALGEYEAALAMGASDAEAYYSIARMRMPGPDCAEWLGRLHEALRPPVYLEIGVGEGKSLALSRPPTLAIGIDPAARLAVGLRAETRIYPERADGFFAAGKYDAAAGGRRIGMAVINGRAFERMLRDFIHVAAHCDERSLVLIPATIPFDEATQRREWGGAFHTGDAWRLAVALRRGRPDLDVFTIRTPPAGLTVVTGFGRGEEAPGWRSEAAMAEIEAIPYTQIELDLDSALNIVENDWDFVLDRLRHLWNTA